MALCREGRFAAVLEALFPVLIHPSRKGDTAIIDCMHRMADDTGPEVFIRQQTAIIARPDSTADLARIRCPTLVIVGDGDVPTPPERAKEIVDGIKGARLVTVPVCGHMSAIERPEAVTDALVGWMQAG